MKLIVYILTLTLLITQPALGANINKQCIVESAGNVKAKSKIGKVAIGYCQIRPKTFKYVTQKLMKTRRRFNINNKRDNIDVANYYMGYLKSKWKGYGKGDRNRLAIASYNAGLNNIKRAAKLSSVKSYNGVISQLPKITGKRYASITIAYVVKVMG
jgi:soluble lytic murein transglycosylase-like protein